MNCAWFVHESNQRDVLVRYWILWKAKDALGICDIMPLFVFQISIDCFVPEKSLICVDVKEQISLGNCSESGNRILYGLIWEGESAGFIEFSMDECSSDSNIGF